MTVGSHVFNIPILGEKVEYFYIAKLFIKTAKKGKSKGDLSVFNS